MDVLAILASAKVLGRHETRRLKREDEEEGGRALRSGLMKDERSVNIYALRGL